MTCARPTLSLPSPRLTATGRSTAAARGESLTLHRAMLMETATRADGPATGSLLVEAPRWVYISAAFRGGEWVSLPAGTHWQTFFRAVG